jgi:hypothetical protein
LRVRRHPKNLYYPSDHRAGIGVHRVFISIAAMVMLSLIEGRIDVPEEFRSRPTCIGNGTEEVVYNCIAKLKG